MEFIAEERAGFISKLRAGKNRLC